ncbi:hypothetical protein L914_19702, partial [Phytophthora nicotianae]
ASVGDAVKVECPAEGGPSGSLKPRSDVIILDDSEGEAEVSLEMVGPDVTPTIKEEGPLSTVKEEAAQGDTIEPSSLQPELSSTRQVLPASGPSSLGTPPSPSSRMTDVIDLTADEDLDERVAWNSEVSSRMYVEEQVRRWERAQSEYVSSPTVRYEWPSPGPNFQVWYVPANATSEYIATRMSMARHFFFFWISEWNLVRLSPNAVDDDLLALSVDLDTLSAVECIALLQTLFFEAGFRFCNLIPGWSRTRTSRLNPEVVLGVAQDLQHLLALELPNWRDIASEVPSRVVLALGLNVPKPDAEEDNRLEGIGIRTVRSPVGSSLGESDLKRQHPAPSSIPSLSSHLSLRTPTQASYDSSLPDAMTTSSSRRSSSLFGASARSSEESNVSGTSGSQTSRMTHSSLSSGWSFGGATAASHMPYAGPSGKVMTAQGSAIPDAGGSGGQVRQTFIPAPRVQVDQDDVEMAESRGARIRSARRSKTSR